MSIRKVVIRDGDAFMRMCTKQILAENGFEVAESANGIEASWESQPLALMDITKSEMNNQSTQKDIKKTDPGANINNGHAMRRQVLKTGTTDTRTDAGRDQKDVELAQPWDRQTPK